MSRTRGKHKRGSTNRKMSNKKSNTKRAVPSFSIEEQDEAVDEFGRQFETLLQKYNYGQREDKEEFKRRIEDIL